PTCSTGAEGPPGGVALPTLTPRVCPPGDVWRQPSPVGFPMAAPARRQGPARPPRPAHCAQRCYGAGENAANVGAFRKLHETAFEVPNRPPRLPYTNAGYGLQFSAVPSLLNAQSAATKALSPHAPATASVWPPSTRIASSGSSPATTG